MDAKIHRCLVQQSLAVLSSHLQIRMQILLAQAKPDPQEMAIYREDMPIS